VVHLHRVYNSGMRKGSFKGKLILLTVLVVLFGIFLLLKFFFFNGQTELGEIRVVSTPQSVVYLDQIQIGNTPVRQKMKVGEYLIKLIPNKEASQSATWQGKIKVYKNAVTYVGRVLGNSDISTAGEISTLTKMETKPTKDNVGEIAVESDPQGALVYLDLDEKGVAPLILYDVPKGTHELSIYLPGFFRRTLKLNVEAGHRTSTSVKLAIDQLSQQESTKSATIKNITKEQQPTSKASAGDDGAKKIVILIKETPTGWLRVRSEPSIDASESAKVNPGESYELVEEKPNWYKILFNDEQEGWVAAQYSEKVTN